MVADGGGVADGSSVQGGGSGGGGLVDATGKPLSKNALKKLAKNLKITVAELEAKGTEEVSKLLAIKACG